jgi:hypothetical protein
MKDRPLSDVGQWKGEEAMNDLDPEADLPLGHWVSDRSP